MRDSFRNYYGELPTQQQEHLLQQAQQEGAHMLVDNSYTRFGLGDCGPGHGIFAGVGALDNTVPDRKDTSMMSILLDNMSGTTMPHGYGLSSEDWCLQLSQDDDDAIIISSSGLQSNDFAHFFNGTSDNDPNHASHSCHSSSDIIISPAGAHYNAASFDDVRSGYDSPVALQDPSVGKDRPNDLIVTNPSNPKPEWRSSSTNKCSEDFIGNKTIDLSLENSDNNYDDDDDDDDEMDRDICIIRKVHANDKSKIDTCNSKIEIKSNDKGGKNYKSKGNQVVSKNLISERRRRKKLNEKLYSLRAIVPKISKMDKASIVGDAISYVRDLQRQVEEIENDILTLHSSYKMKKSSGQSLQPSSCYIKKLPQFKILELDVLVLTNEPTYHLRIHVKKGDGVLLQLTKALDALDFEIVNANLTTISDRFINTIVMKLNPNGEMLVATDLRAMILEIFPKFGLLF